jgi:glycosyltransferase involved in cell wall biosynthesis
VLAEYGPVGASVREACRCEKVPLVVHFHGYDASKQEVLDSLRDEYLKMFQEAAGIIAVSRSMARKLVELGAPKSKVCYLPYGVDCERFSGAVPAMNPPRFVAVGRFVEKKAPHMTLMAFATALATFPEAKLTMIGDGPLMGVCKDLAGSLKLHKSVQFLGAQSHDVVRQQMRSARAFVQHSVVSSDGDCEGTPVAIVEASSMGLPVVATRHAGIPDVVIEGRTGLLADERDTETMAQHLVRLAADVSFSEELGRNGSQFVRSALRSEACISHLVSILRAAMQGRPLQEVQDTIDKDLQDAIRGIGGNAEASP